jgi:hypothetical protein
MELSPQSLITAEIILSQNHNILVLTASGEYDKSISDLTEARRLVPAHPNATRYLETTLLRRGANFERLGRVRVLLLYWVTVCAPFFGVF